MVEIKNRWSGAVIFKSDTAETTAQAIVELITRARERSERANLRSADLRGADLRSADLSGADLSGANLRSANLRSADLRSANLRSADLRSADLRSADLRGADLRSADLRGADLRGANVVSLGYDVRGYHFLLLKEGDDLLVSAGCRRFTLAEARAHWGRAHADEPLLRAEILARLDMADAIATAYGWNKQEQAQPVAA